MCMRRANWRALAAATAVCLMSGLSQAGPLGALPDTLVLRRGGRGCAVGGAARGGAAAVLDPAVRVIGDAAVGAAPDVFIGHNDRIAYGTDFSCVLFHNDAPLLMICRMLRQNQHTIFSP